MSLRSRKPYARPAPRAAPDGQWLHDKAPTGPAKTRASPPKPSIAPSGPAVPASSNNNVIIVSNLHYEITPKDLMSIFGQIGTLVREPLLRYDRSGRSTGEAVVSFETAMEATRAKKQFHGLLAKGQPMTIAFYVAPRAPRRVVSAPSTTRSLLNRIEKPPLSQRLSKEEADATPSGPRSLAGPVRTKPVRGGGGGRPTKGPGKKQPKSAEELDKELDAFMGDADGASASGNDSTAVAVGSDGTAAVAGGDVDMA